jgi:hypothetical protein
VKRFILLGMFCAVFILLSYNCYAQTTVSLDLLNNAKEHDGKIVVYKGEVIGDIMMRGDHAWLHVNDGYIAIGIWASQQLIQDISFAGDYHKRGDMVEVSGTFHRSCLEHGGDLDIHAQAIKIITPGVIVNSPINKRKIYFGVSSLIVVLLVYALKRLFQGRKE